MSAISHLLTRKANTNINVINVVMQFVPRRLALFVCCVFDIKVLFKTS